MKFEFSIIADENEIFAQEAFDQNIGKITSMKPYGQVRIVSAKVIDNGSVCRMEVEEV